MKVVVVGGGASGIFAAIECAKRGNEVILIEKKSSLGNKLKITGKGRCNLTFDGDIDDFKKNVVNNFKFMYSSFMNFDNSEVVKYFNNIGIETKIERGGRIFPVCDDAKKVVLALEGELKKYNVEILYNSAVSEIIKQDDFIEAVKLKNGAIIECDKCILATGGNSYKATGSTGDGYEILKKLGHNIIDIKPGLIPLKSNDNICKKLQGLTLKNIGYKLIDKNNNSIIYEDFGELLFAHFGITGPVVLSSSSKLNRIDKISDKLKDGEIEAIIDLKPALDVGKLDKRICRDFEKYNNKEFKNSLSDLLPQKMIKVIVELSNIDENKKVNQITKEERKKLIDIIKNLKIKVCGFLDGNLAIITCGGADVKQINPKTMESKIVKGLYIVGELLDVDAYTGGYNLQIAFSTAKAASN